MKCSRIQHLFVIAIATLVACHSAPQPSPHLTGRVSAFEVVEELNRMAARDLWPGFKPAGVPLLLFDGERTLLFNHPAPPPEFTAVAGRPEVRLVAGRHAAVTANSSTQVGGIQTATVILKPDLESAQKGAALAIHEAFHVYQRGHHPKWSANEVELFTYPVTDTSFVMDERLEMEALRRALESRDRDACWAGSAMRIRKARFALLPAGASGYERASELNEGIATYVEKRAIGLPDSLMFPPDVFRPEEVRLRTYTSGLAIARLLDRFDPAWRATLEHNDSLALDGLLTRALEQRGAMVRDSTCDFNEVERDAVLTSASEDVDSLRVQREHRRLLFMEQPGWKLVVTTGKSPLFPNGFDPLNVHVLLDGEVLHSRYVKLGNDNGSVEVLDRASLTKAAGPHPLFNGVRTLTISGIPAGALTITRSPGLNVRGAGIQLTMGSASVDTTGTTVTVRLP